jgi:type IV pilus assembly protein PilC
VTTTFKYKARDAAGRTRSGKLAAASEDAAITSLRAQGLIPISVDQTAASGLQREISIPGLGNRIRQKDVALMSRQFSTMVNAGLSLIRALTVLIEQADSPPLVGVLTEVRTDVERGQSLSDAMAKHPRAFNRLYIAMIRAGEVGGVLDETLNRVADILEANLSLRSKIRSAMAYPAVVLMLIVLVTTAMIVFVVPVFEDLYADLGEGASLPLPTQLLVALSALLRSMWFVVIAVAALGVWGFRRWIATEGGRLTWDRLRLRLPVFGKLVHKTALARFSRTMAVLSRTGVPILQAIDIVGETSGNRVVSSALGRVRAAVREGEGLATQLARHDVFPPMVVQMLAVGEETGALDAMLNKVADYYEREVEDSVAALTSLIEPLLIVVMGVSVGAILIALYLPIFNIAGLVS